MWLTRAAVLRDGCDPHRIGTFPDSLFHGYSLAFLWTFSVQETIVSTRKNHSLQRRAVVVWWRIGVLYRKRAYEPDIEKKHDMMTQDRDCRVTLRMRGYEKYDTLQALSYGKARECYSVLGKESKVKICSLMLPYYLRQV